MRPHPAGPPHRAEPFSQRNSMPTFSPYRSPGRPPGAAVTAGDRETILQQVIDRALAYIVGNRSISEVILSGGDPLVLDDDQLVAILEALRGIDIAGAASIPHGMIDLPDGGERWSCFPTALSKASPAPIRFAISRDASIATRWIEPPAVQGFRFRAAVSRHSQISRSHEKTALRSDVLPGRTPVLQDDPLPFSGYHASMDHHVRITTQSWGQS
jgi:hypothetical protein